MTSPTVKPRQMRAKRREAMLNFLAKLVGCLTVVVSVAFVFYVVCRQIWRGPAVDPIYEQMAAEDFWVPLTESPVIIGTQSQPSSTDRPVVAAVAIPQASRAEANISYESKRQEIEQTAQRFFAAKSVQEKVLFCRDPERVRPLMEAYYQKHPLRAPEWQKLGWMVPVKEAGYRLVFVQALFNDRPPISVVAEETSDGSFRIDWESCVRYSEIDWQDFMAERPGEPKLFRVIASRSTSPTAAGQEALRLKHPTEKGTVTAYFDRNDPQFRSLVLQLQLRNWKDVPLTLRLCYPRSKSDADAVKIAGIEGQGWLILQNTRS